MKYYAMIDGEQRGPYELSQLAEAGVRPSTYVWCKGMDDWEKAEDVADVCRMFRVRLHNLMHPGSVDAEQQRNLPVAQGNEPAAADSTEGVSRFGKMLSDTGSDPLPSLEEIEKRDNQVPPPHNLLFIAILVTIFFFPPTGGMAIYYALKARKLWKDKPASEEAGAAKRMAAMMIGITFFIGLIFYAFLLHL